MPLNMNARFLLRLLGSLLIGPWAISVQAQSVVIDSIVPPCPGQANGKISSSLFSASATDFSLVELGTGDTTESNTTGTFENLDPGNYRVRTTSGAGLDSSVVVSLVATATEVLLDTALDPACANSPTGFIVVSPSAGVAPFSYSLGNDTVQSSAAGVFSNLPAGGYTITATDARGCSDDVSATLVDPAPLTLAATVTDVQCFGDANGQINATFSGGTAPYDLTVSGNGGPFLVNGATSPESFANLSADSYLLTLTDTNGCQAVAIAQVDGPTQPLELLVLGSTNTGCAGGAQNSGTITLLAVGGTPSYDYEVDGFIQNGGANVPETITGLGTDIFLPTVTDAQGCTDTADNSVSINSGNVTIDIVGQADVSCAGEDDGFIQVSASGGTLPLDFLLEDGAGNVVYEFIDSLTTFVAFPDLGADSYEITITDALGCDNVRTGTITEPTPLTLTTTPTASQCAGVLSGSAMGGTAPYTFFVGGASQGATLTNLPLSSGNYVVAVQDDNGCLDQDTVQVGVSNPINIIDNSVLVEAANCFNSNDGSITFQFTAETDADLFVDDSVNVIAYPAVAPGSFSVDTLSGGRYYTIVAVDGSGCEDSIKTFVGRPGSPLSLDVEVNDVACVGEATGSILAQGKGGTQPYQYLLGSPPAQSSGVFGNLTAGSYLVQVVDTQGCTASLSIGVGEPAAPLSLINFSATDTVNCQGDSSGQITFAAQGGTPDTAYRYRLLRSPGILIDSDTFNTVVTLDELTSGDYELTIFDANDCEVNSSFKIEERQSVAWTSVVLDSVRCAGDSNGAVTFAGISGGTAPYQLSWLDGSSSLGDTVAVSGGVAAAMGLPSEGFAFRVSDDLGCQRDTSLFIPEPAPLDLSLGSDTLLFIPCDGGDNGRVDLVAVGGNVGASFTFYQTLSGQLDSINSPNNQALFTDLSASSNSVRYEVVDSRGCTDSLRVRISDAAPLVPTYEPQDSLFCNYTDTIVLRGTGIFSQAIFTDGNNPLNYLLSDSLFLPGNLPASTADSQVVAVLIEGFDTTPNGCFFDTTIRLVVYDTLEILLPEDTTFCSNADNFTIQVDPVGGTLQGQGISQSQDGSFLFIPNLFPQGFTTDLTYTITDSSRAACVSTRVVRYEVIPAPVASFEVLTDPRCEGQPITLVTDSMGANFGHRWQFNQDPATEQLGDTARIELALGSNVVAYALTNQATGCSDTLNRELQVQAVPRFDFAWERICEGDEVQFRGSLTDSSNLSGLDRLTWRWTFDGVGPVEDVLLRSNGRFPPSLVGHRFDTLVADVPGTYLTEVRVRTDSGCVGTTRREVTILPELRPHPAQPYDQRFERDSLPWLTLDGAGIWGWEPLDLTDTLAGNLPFGTGTLTVIPDGNYGVEQRGSLLSPCFDLSEFTRPAMSLDIWSETDLGNDGTVLQYLNESNGSSTWRTLGSVSDGVATGLNWYNRSDIFARPGDPNLQGWSGRFGDWREAVHRLDLEDLVEPDHRSRLRFRLSFASDDRPDSLAGFSLRAVRIDERKRQVLWETFRAEGSRDPVADAVETELDSLDRDFLRLYHPLVGPFFDDNPTPPRVRSLYYGISLPDQVVLDGNQYNGPLQAFVLNDLNLRSLRAPGVDSLVVAGDRLRLAGVHESGQVSLRLALVQDLADQPGVVRAILPDGAGVILNLAEGDNQAGALGDLFSPNAPLDVTTESSTPIYGVVWLQDLTTKEVWQAARLDGLAWEALLTNLSLERRARPASGARYDELRVYPVPAQTQLTVAWPEPLSAAWTWAMLDAQGKGVAAGRAEAGSQRLCVDLTTLSEGLYHLRLQNPETGQWLHRKVSIGR
jgi:hypothetical protein